ncbi:MAG: pantoate--beta-alanine ligase [Gammaproteobacteria bacterium]
MLLCTTIAEIRRQVADWKASGERVALVPTMGNLHDGHLALVAQARQQADRVVVSVFVNPLQFNELDDFDAYPRTEAEDQKKLEAAAVVDTLFLPAFDEVYPGGQSRATKVLVPGLGDILEGEWRPGHFTGVATVVNKLFNMVLPDLAMFGEKDFQQLVLIQRMVADLNMPVAIVPVATTRESDGLAMSSRNSRLTPEQRLLAPALYQCLQRVREQMDQGSREFATLEFEAMDGLKQEGFLPEYVAIRRSHDLEKPEPSDRKLVILTAARLGGTRLIDNLQL